MQRDRISLVSLTKENCISLRLDIYDHMALLHPFHKNLKYFKSERELYRYIKNRWPHAKRIQKPQGGVQSAIRIV